MFGKSELLELIAATNRGILASTTQRRLILSKASQLEERNPTPTPTQALSLLNGDWRLQYTTSTELLGIDRFPLLSLGQVYQCIRTETKAIYNIAEIDSLPYCQGLVTVCALFAAESEHRLSVKFNRSVLGLQQWLNYQNPSQFIERIQVSKRLPAIDFAIQERQGWVDLTYLDDDLRINRGNEGSLFILTRV